MWNFLKTTLRQIFPDDISSEFRKFYIRNKLEKGIYEHDEKEMSILKHLVKPGNIVLDIGANIGSYTRILSKLANRNGSVHAFEPVPLTYGYLIFNMKRDMYRNVITYNVAVGHKLGLCNIILPNMGMEDIYLARLKKRETVSGKEFIVPMVTLDSLYPHCFRKVDFIKCDVEGAELLVFRGAKQVLIKNKPRIICEVSSGCEEPGKTESEVFQLLEDSGYQAYFYDGRKLISCTSIDNKNRNANYLFFHVDDPEANSIIEQIDSNYL